MKKTTTFISILAIAATVFASCQNNEKKEASEEISTSTIAAGSIVYFQLDQVLAGYDYANDLSSEVQAKVDAIQKEVDRRRTKLENGIKDFQTKVEKGLMTSLQMQDTQKKLQEQEQAFQQFAGQKQNEIMEEQQVMMNKIADALKTYLESYNEEKGYAMILSNQNGVPVIVGDPELDVTNEIIKGINEEYVKTKNK